MPISAKLKEAIKKTSDKFPGVCFGEYHVRQFVGKFSEFFKESGDLLTKQERFMKARLNTLNYFNISDDKTQNAYKSLIGAYFGPQGGKESGRVRRAKAAKANDKKAEGEAFEDEMLQDAKEHEAFHKPCLQGE